MSLIWQITNRPCVPIRSPIRCAGNAAKSIAERRVGTASYRRLVSVSGRGTVSSAEGTLRALRLACSACRSSRLERTLRCTPTNLPEDRRRPDLGFIAHDHVAEVHGPPRVSLV